MYADGQVCPQCEVTKLERKDGLPKPGGDHYFAVYYFCATCRKVFFNNQDKRPCAPETENNLVRTAGASLDFLFEDVN